MAQKKLETEIDCKCRILVGTGQTLDRILLAGPIAFSDKCDRSDFDLCADNCNQKISNQTNGYDLDKPKAGDQTDKSLGQLYCDRIGSDVSGSPLMLSVTLECLIVKEIKEDRNGTLVVIGTSSSDSEVTRIVESGFKQKLRCVDNKYTKAE